MSKRVNEIVAANPRDDNGKRRRKSDSLQAKPSKSKSISISNEEIEEKELSSSSNSSGTESSNGSEASDNNKVNNNGIGIIPNRECGQCGAASSNCIFYLYGDHTRHCEMNDTSMIGIYICDSCKTKQGVFCVTCNDPICINCPKKARTDLTTCVQCWRNDKKEEATENKKICSIWKDNIGGKVKIINDNDDTKEARASKVGIHILFYPQNGNDSNDNEIEAIKASLIENEYFVESKEDKYQLGKNGQLTQGYVQQLTERIESILENASIDIDEMNMDKEPRCRCGLPMEYFKSEKNNRYYYRCKNTLLKNGRHSFQSADGQWKRGNKPYNSGPKRKNNKK